jgi:uncharacterized protein (TIGR03435 family)
MKRKVWVVAGACCMLALPSSFAQQKSAPLTFEVASIRPSGMDAVNGGIKPLPGGDGYITQNVTVKLMMSLMYELPMRQIVGGPAWLDSERFDIEAKADHRYSREDLHAMFRNLLQERFNLKTHIDTRQGKIYALTVDKAGLRMTPDQSTDEYNVPVTYTGDGEVEGKGVPLQYLSWWLGQILQAEGRPVVDQTGLKGSYDFNLTYLPERYRDVGKDGLPAEMQDRPLISDALRDQLGLDLKPAQGPVNYLVIDHVDKPSAN